MIYPTDQEWKILNLIWDTSPISCTELAKIGPCTGARTATLLTHLRKKGWIYITEVVPSVNGGTCNLYAPTMTREQFWGRLIMVEDLPQIMDLSEVIAEMLSCAGLRSEQVPGILARARDKYDRRQL